MATESICCHISDLDEYESWGSEDLGDLEDLGDVDDLVSSDADSPHVRLGSRQVAQTFELIEDAHKEDAAFTNFWVKLNNFLTNFLQVIQLPIPGGKRIQFKANDKVGHVQFGSMLRYTDIVKQITECRFLKVNYESFVDWRLHTDYLRCSPKFFNTARFDCVFIQTEAKVIFGRLLFLFECVVGDITLSLALIHPFDAPTGVRLRKDKHLNIYHVWVRPQAQAKFFSVRSIIRGALLVPDGSTDYLVIDTVDTDMFLRVKELHLAAGHPICIWLYPFKSAFSLYAW